MFKVLKNLKQSFWSVLVIIILLCVQATADLALPDYTSKIVNGGIQAGGIESAIPEIITKEDMNNLLLFTDKDEEILDNYSLIGNEQNEFETKITNKYLGKNKNIESDTLYILKELNNDEKEEFETLISTPLMILTTVEDEETANQIKEKITENMAEIQKQLFASQSLMEIIKGIPETQRNQMLSSFTSKIEQMSDSIKSQAAISSVKVIYKNAGVDTDKLQNEP